MKKLNILLIVIIFALIYMFKFKTTDPPPYREDVTNFIVEPGTYIIDDESSGIYDVKNLVTGEYIENLALYRDNEITIDEQWLIDGSKDVDLPKELSAGTYVVGQGKDIQPGVYELQLNDNYKEFEITLQKHKGEDLYYNEKSFEGNIVLEVGDVLLITSEKGENVFEVEKKQV